MRGKETEEAPQGLIVAGGNWRSGKLGSYRRGWSGRMRDGHSDGAICDDHELFY